MKKHHALSSGLAMVVALIFVVLGVSPALAQAGERAHHGRGHSTVYAEGGGHAYGEWRHGRYVHEAPAHVVRHEVVYEVHRPVHREVVHVQPYLSLNIPLPLSHVSLW